VLDARLSNVKQFARQWLPSSRCWTTGTVRAWGNNFRTVWGVALNCALGALLHRHLGHGERTVRCDGDRGQGGPTATRCGRTGNVVAWGGGQSGELGGRQPGSRAARAGRGRPRVSAIGERFPRGPNPVREQAKRADRIAGPPFSRGVVSALVRAVCSSSSRRRLAASSASLGFRSSVGIAPRTGVSASRSGNSSPEEQAGWPEWSPRPIG